MNLVSARIFVGQLPNLLAVLFSFFTRCCSGFFQNVPRLYMRRRDFYDSVEKESCSKRKSSVVSVVIYCAFYQGCLKLGDC